MARDLHPSTGTITLGKTPAAPPSVLGTPTKVEHLIEFLALVYGAFDFGHVHLSGTGDVDDGRSGTLWLFVCRRCLRTKELVAEHHDSTGEDNDHQEDEYE